MPADVTASVIAGGSAVAIATTAIGQSAHLTFAGTAGQRVYLAINTPTGSNPNGSSIQLLDHTTSLQVATANGGASGSAWSYYSGLKILQSTGAYTIDFTPSFLGAPWGATFLLGSVPADVTSTITVGGSPVTITTTATGQSAHLTFNGTVGEQVYLGIKTPTGTNANGSSIQLLDHTTNLQVATANGGASGSAWTYCSGLKTLQSTGTYTIDFTPSFLGTPWGATFQLGMSACP